MKKIFNFGKIAADGSGIQRNAVTVEMEYKKDGDKKRFSVSANVWNSLRSDIIMGGQCLDSLTPYFTENATFAEIYRLWKLYHLNDMHPECEHQAAAGWREQAAEKVTLYVFTMTVDAIRERDSLKRRILTAAQNGETWQTSPVEQLLLSLEYSVKSENEALPDNITGYYKLKETEVKALGWLHPEEHSRGILGKPCPVCGYRYGHSWKYFPIPADDEAIILRLLKEGK